MFVVNEQYPKAPSSPMRRGRMGLFEVFSYKTAADHNKYLAVFCLFKEKIVPLCSV
jgi:hypothetical protein